MTSTKTCYYTILEVAKTATNEEIKKSYKKLAIKWHPDKNPDNKDESVEKFRDISEAYETLSNEEKRKKYDLYGFDGPKLSAGSSTRFNFSNANDIFKMFFGSNGFDNKSDNTFFSSYFKSAGSPSYTSGTYSSYATTGTPGSTYFRYAEPSTTGRTTYTTSSGTNRTTYTTSSVPSSGASNASSHYSTYAKYAKGGSGGVFSGTGVSAFGNDTNTSNSQGEELPAEGEKIRKVQQVTRQYPNGTEETIMRTTIISSDGSKEITEENLDGTNKKVYHVAGTKKEVSSNFSGYNFGKREQPTEPEPEAKESEEKKEEKNNENPEGSTTSSSGYSNLNDLYAKYGKSTGGGKVYYADGTEAPTTSSYNSYGSYGSYGNYGGAKVYYTGRK